MSPQTNAVSIIFSGAFQPYTRMTRRGKWVQPDALAYQASQAELAARIKEQLIAKGHRSEDLPVFKNRTPLIAHIIISVTKDLHTKDLDNQIKALLDSAQGLIFQNDLWIDGLTAERSLGGEDLAELVVVAPDIDFRVVEA